ncbi:hypothetical protein GF402_05680 [Candidatus Fermentibacteria bacterium]|nr:hypothetical protein [Candidatus Fermentibacteria bacterium]
MRPSPFSAVMVMAFLAGLYLPLYVHPLTAAALALLSVLLAVVRRYGLARVGMVVSLVVLGSSLRPPEEDRDLLTGPIYNGTVLTVTPRGAMIEVEGDRRWASSKILAAAARRGDRVALMAHGRGRFLQVRDFSLWPSPSFLRRQSRALSAHLEKRIRHPGARALAEALLLGTRAKLPYSVRDLVRKTGTVHLLALSGLHVGLFAAAAYTALKLLLGKGWPASILCLAGVWLYVLMAGARTPTVRAGIMVSAFMLHGLVWGRGLNALSAWALALAAVLLLTPGVAYDMGAKMSFGAVLTLIVLGFRLPGSRRWLAYLGKGLGAGLVVTVGIAPLVSSAYGEVKLLGPVFTVISIPLMLAVMLSALLSMVPLLGAGAALGTEWSAWAWLKLLNTIESPGVSIASPVGYLLWGAALAALWLVGRRRWVLSGLRYCLVRSRKFPRT